MSYIKDQLSIVDTTNEYKRSIKITALGGEKQTKYIGITEQQYQGMKAALLVDEIESSELTNENGIYKQTFYIPVFVEHICPSLENGYYPYTLEFDRDNEESLSVEDPIFGNYTLSIEIWVNTIFTIEYQKPNQYMKAFFTAIGYKFEE